MYLPDCYSMRFTTLSNYHLIDWRCGVSFFVCLRDDLILATLLQQFETESRWTQTLSDYHPYITSEPTNQVPRLIPFSDISNKSKSVNNSNFIVVFLKQACHANPGADRKWAGSSYYISICFFGKILKYIFKFFFFLHDYNQHL